MSGHEFPEWVDVREVRESWRQDDVVELTVLLCSYGFLIFLGWTIERYGPLLGWW